MTGGAGFIGSHLVDHLLAVGREVVVVDNFSTGRAGNLPTVGGTRGRLRVVEADLGDVVGEIGEGGDLGAFDEIYHLAAAVGVALVMSDPVGSIETNVGLTAGLARRAVSSGPGGGASALLLASSSEVYGKGVGEVFSEDDDVLYGPTSITRWSYALSKAIDEYVVLETAKSASMRAVAVRFFNTVGPRQRGHYGMVVPRFVEAAERGEPLTVFGDGTQSRCFADVRDVVPALPKLLAHDGASGRAVNVGSDRPVTVLELARLVIERVGSDSVIEHKPYGSVYGPGFEDLARRRPDLRRVKDLIGFEARRSLVETIDDVIGWVRSGGERESV